MLIVCSKIKAMWWLFYFFAIIIGAHCEVKTPVYNLQLLSDISNDTKCVDDIQIILDALRNKEIWSYAMLDASTKIPNGILTGSVIDYGNYDECISVVGPKSSFIGKHCMATFSIKVPAPDSNVENSISLNYMWSYCIPDSCSTMALQKMISSILPVTSLTVKDSDCHTKNGNQLNAVDWFAITVLLLFLLLAISSTVYDCLKPKRPSVNILCAFSLYTNGKKLLDTSRTTGTMAALNGIRFLSMVWIIMGHRYFFMTTSANMNQIEVLTLLEKLQYQFVSGAVLAVDTFFLLSGLLNSYHLLKVLQERNSFPVVLYYVHRFIRITPALAFIVLMYTTWFSHLGDGPAWDRMTEPGKQLCVENWWPTLLYISNYYNPISQCAGQSWYLAVDMQLFWISPLIIVPLWKWPKKGQILLILWVLVSIVIPFAVSYAMDIKVPFIASIFSEDYLKITQYAYVPTHMRATPYFIGIAFGYFLHVNNKKCKTFSIGKKFVALGWFIALGLCVGVILSQYPFLQKKAEDFNQFLASIFISFHRPIWCIGILWVIFACLNGYGGIVNSILSWNVFTPLHRLTYCMFLTHMAVQTYQIAISRTTDYFTDFNQMHRFCGDLFITIIFATLLYLMFESPVMMVEKYLKNRKVSAVKEHGSDNHGYVTES